MLYYPLHVHTALGSICDSTLQISAYVKKAKEYGLPALAITDHGSLAAMFEFIDECKASDIKPIIGMEAYEVDDISSKDKHSNHLILLAKNDEGLQNLLQIHNDAQIRGFYYRPRTDKEALKRWGKGIIALSACANGSIPQAILNRDLEKCVEKISLYKDCFDQFFFEIQPGNFKEQQDINDTLVYLSHELDIPLVITNDIHYLVKEDYKSHDYHVKLGRKREKEKISSEALIYPDTCYYFMSEADIRNSFPRSEYVTDEVIDCALQNAKMIADSCDINTDFKVQIPVVNFDEEGVLRDICYERLNQISQRKCCPQVYVDRLEHELSVISQKGFCGYFLIVHDYVTWAKKNDIKVGPGRGSAAGSLVSYLLQISAADPIVYNLMFERFLDPNREAVPDIDVDFTAKDRDKVMRYLVEKYGYDYCAQISAIHTRKAKAAIKDAARILDIDLKTAEEISKFIPTVAYDDDGNKNMDLDITTSCEIVEELATYRHTQKELFDLAIQLEDLPSASSVHAAGIVLSPHNLRSMIPLTRTVNPDILATSLDLDSVEKVLVKYDLLALSTLDIIDAVEKEADITFDYENNDFADPKVWSLINGKTTAGVFQISSSTYKRRMHRLNPRNIQELATVLALLRGPCISANLDEEFMLINEGKKQVQHIHPIYDYVTRNTNGIIIFQEQVMELVVYFGMTLSKGYRIIKSCAKKKLDEVKQYKERFLELAQKQNCPLETAERMFSLIEKSSQYSFNLSHAISYSMLTYCTAWLKVYYRDIFTVKLLSNKFTEGKTTEYTSLISDTKALGYKFLPVDINKSEVDFTLENGDIRMGLCAIKGLGDKAITALLKTRQMLGQISGFQEFLDNVEKKKFNKNKVLISIFAGLFDCFLGQGETRKDLYLYYCTLTKTEPQEEISIAKGYVIKPNSRAWKSLQTQVYGAVFFEKDEL